MFEKLAEAFSNLVDALLEAFASFFESVTSMLGTTSHDYGDVPAYSGHFSSSLVLFSSPSTGG